jgi:hypothetical protein
MRDVDRIIQLVRDICPAVEVNQLRVLHPGADDGCGISTNLQASFKSK